MVYALELFYFYSLPVCCFFFFTSSSSSSALSYFVKLFFFLQLYACTFLRYRLRYICSGTQRTRPLTLCRNVGNGLSKCLHLRLSWWWKVKWKLVFRPPRGMITWVRGTKKATPWTTCTTAILHVLSIYHKVVYKSRGLSAIFSFLVWLLFKWGFYMSEAYMQYSECAKPVKAVWHSVTSRVKAKLDVVNVTKLSENVNNNNKKNSSACKELSNLALRGRHFLPRLLIKCGRFYRETHARLTIPCISSGRATAGSRNSPPVLLLWWSIYLVEKQDESTRQKLPARACMCIHLYVCRHVAKGGSEGADEPPFFSDQKKKSMVSAFGSCVFRCDRASTAVGLRVHGPEPNLESVAV